MTEDQTIDVRKKVATVVGISCGTLSHASEVLRNGDPEVQQALCKGEIKIDRAWRWSKQSKMRQRENLKLYHRNGGMEKVAKKLIARQLRKLKGERLSAHRWKPVTPNEALKGLGLLPPRALKSIQVIFIKAPGRVFALSEEIRPTTGFERRFRHASRNPDEAARETHKADPDRQPGVLGS